MTNKLNLKKTHDKNKTNSVFSFYRPALGGYLDPGAKV
jgi:hypothetical protein